MEKRGWVLATATAVMLLPAASSGQGIVIDHKAVACVVAEKHPRFNACFTPVSGVARARVYFRLSDGPPDWYYVEMKSDVPCFAGVLPKPKKSLVGRRMLYYLDAFDRKFAESRTAESEAAIVQSASECKSKLVAPLVNSAAVAVFPGMPAGFAGSAALGGLTTAAIVGGGVAVAGGGVAVAASSGDESPATTVAPVATLPGTSVTTAATVPTTSTTTSTALPGFTPVFKVFLGATRIDADTLTASSPAKLEFDMCESSGPYRMNFGVSVNGTLLRTTCNSTITFTSSGPTFGGRSVVAPSVYQIEMTIGSEGPNNRPRGSRSLQLTLGTDPCSGDSKGPLVSLLKPPSGSSYPPSTVPPFPDLKFEASADDATTGNNGVSLVEYKVDWGGASPKLLGPVTSGSPWTFNWPNSDVNAYLGAACQRGVTVQAYAVDGCGNSSITPATVTVTLNNTGACSSPSPARSVDSSTLVSELKLTGASAQVVVNGDAAFPRAGRTVLMLRPRAGENRVEATLVEGRSPGTWTFDLGSIGGLRPGSVRVIAGEVAQAAGGVLHFGLHGRPGERLVFAFVAEP